MVETCYFLACDHPTIEGELCDVELDAFDDDTAHMLGECIKKTWQLAGFYVPDEHDGDVPTDAGEYVFWYRFGRLVRLGSIEAADRKDAVRMLTALTRRGEILCYEYAEED